MLHPPDLSPDSAPRLNHAVADPPLIVPLLGAPRPLFRRCSARCYRRCCGGAHPPCIALESRRNPVKSDRIGALRKNYIAVPTSGTAVRSPRDPLRASIWTISAAISVASPAIIAEYHRTWAAGGKRAAGMWARGWQ